MRIKIHLNYYHRIDDVAGTFNVTQPLEFAPDCKGGTTRTFNPTTGGENPPTDAAGLVYPSTALFIIVLLMSLLL
jgi:hypothetical protein